MREETGRLTKLLDINPETHAPPILLFVWGSLRFTCVLAKASQKFILFRPSGAPARARVQVSFQEFTNGSLEAKEIKRETANFTKVYIVGAGRNAEQHRRAGLQQPATLAAPGDPQRGGRPAPAGPRPEAGRAAPALHRP